MIATFIWIWYFFAITQLIYWGIVFQRFAWFRPSLLNPKKELPAISIIICARNESANLQNNLELILTQDYPIFELLVVNDDSTDKTAEILATFKAKYPSILRVITINNKKKAGKKGALAAGIKMAKYEWLLLTDADCQPKTSHWIQAMQACIKPKTEIVLAYGPYKEENKWVNKWVQYETTYVAIQYFSLALWRMPYMGVGRNLMYKKSLYLANKGFSTHEHIMSGDDDLFINEVANTQNTAICLDENSWMLSPAPTSWSALYHQKTRHYSSSSHYQWHFKIILGLLSLGHSIYYLGILFFILANIWNPGVLIVFIIRTFLLYLVFIKCAKKLHQFKILPYLWLMDLILPFYYAIFASSTISIQNKKWK